jgi:hypothetical protein
MVAHHRIFLTGQKIRKLATQKDVVMSFDADSEATMPALLSQRAYLADESKSRKSARSGKADLAFKVIAGVVICVLLYKLLVP